MFRQSLIAFTIVCAVLFAADAGASSVEAISGLTGGTTSGQSRFGGETGFSFTLTAPVEVTALGSLDLSYFTFVPKGFEQDVIVGLFNLTTSTELGRVVLPAGASGTLIDNFRYLHLPSPVTLTPGATYEVINVVAPPLTQFGGDGETLAATFTADPRFANITFHATNANPGSPFTDVFPLVSPIGVSAFGANLLVTPVPEPATWGLLAIGFAFLAVKRRKGD